MDAGTGTVPQLAGEDACATRAFALCRQLWTSLFLALILAGGFTGCACLSRSASTSKALRTPRFNFQTDTFAYANELVWEYHFDPVTGQTRHHRSAAAEPYTHHCFVMIRAARQFFHHALFDPTLPPVSPATCRQRIRQVLQRASRGKSPPSERVVIPGYANLRQFSRVQERLLKSECNGAWRSYTQRGHWRILMPFTRRHQAALAGELARKLSQGETPIVHLIRFPQLTINHAVLLFEQFPDRQRITFHGYDPNNPDDPILFTFDKTTRTFLFPRTKYFAGGKVDLYEIYRGWVF